MKLCVVQVGHRKDACYSTHVFGILHLAAFWEMKIVQPYGGLIHFSLQKQNVLKGTLVTPILNSNQFPLFVNGTSESGRIETKLQRIKVAELQLKESMDVSFTYYSMSLI